MINTKAGFSLAELVIAIMLIAIAAVAALSFLFHCHSLALRPDARITAANFCRETAENLYKRDFSDPLLVQQTDTSASLPAEGAFGSGFLGRYPTATRKYTITDKADYKLVTVRVTWTK